MQRYVERLQRVVLSSAQLLQILIAFLERLDVDAEHIGISTDQIQVLRDVLIDVLKRTGHSKVLLHQDARIVDEDLFHLVKLKSTLLDQGEPGELDGQKKKRTVSIESSLN